MPHSHHSHSGQFCAHAKGSLEGVVLEAIKQNFSLYGLSEHIPRDRAEDLYPEEVERGLTPASLHAQFGEYLEEAYRLKALYQNQIQLLVGLETEYIGTANDLDALDALLRKYYGRIEYVVGSVHHVNGVPIDFDRPTFDTAVAQFSGGASSTEVETMNRFLDAYFDAQCELIQRIRPEIIGHIDLCRLYEPNLKLKAYPSAWEKLERNVRFAIEYGALFELNAAALRKGWEGCYPGEDVFKMILANGGRFALSDDSHGPHAVGLNYDRMFKYLRRHGLEEIWYLQTSTKRNAAGRLVQPAKFEGEWWTHPFWTAREGIQEL